MSTSMRRWPIWQPPEPTPQQEQRGLLWLISGVGAGDWPLKWAYAAFRDAGVSGAIRIFRWQRPGCGPLNVVFHRDNRRRAARLAEEIVQRARLNPAAAVDLVGYSGGGGLALFALEALPDDVRVRNVVLCQPAVSPTYDLTTALKRVRGQTICYRAPGDWLILGLGTLLFGTLDRRHCIAAGNVGFRLERAIADPTLCARFRQRAWRLEALRGGGHWGGHLGTLGYRWNRRYVAPYLLATGAGSAGPSSVSCPGGVPACPFDASSAGSC